MKNSKLPGSSTLQSSTSRASRLLALLLGLFTVGFAALFVLNLVIGNLMDELRERGANEQARLFIGEELVRTIKSIELDFNRMFVSTSVTEQKRLQLRIREKAFKLEHDLLVLKDGGSVKRSINLNIEGIDSLIQQVVYKPQLNDPHNLLELIEIGPQLDRIREKADELASLLHKKAQIMTGHDTGRLSGLNEELKQYYKHIPSLFVRLDENANRLFYDSQNRITAFEKKRAARRSTYKQAQNVLGAGIVFFVLGTGALLARQLTAINFQLLQSGEGMRIAKEQAELANNSMSESVELLEQEMAERQKAEEALQRLNVSLESSIAEEVSKNREKDRILLQQEKLASIGQLAAGVAHEINNPMGFIMSNLNTLKEYVATLQKYCQITHESMPDSCRITLQQTRKQMDLDYILDDLEPLLAESTEGAERVRRIVLDLKDFARPDEQEMNGADLNQLVQSTINIVSSELKYVAELDLQLGKIPKIICHPQQINQVISNLLVNAAQAIEQHGVITVCTSHKDSSVVLTVTDTGKGILPELCNRIFDPFFTTKDVGKGTGLGLSISYDIIKKHGGEITVESQVGGGTTFVVTLPVNGGVKEAFSSVPGAVVG